MADSLQAAHSKRPVAEGASGGGDGAPMLTRRCRCSSSLPTGSRLGWKVRGPKASYLAQSCTISGFKYTVAAPAPSPALSRPRDMAARLL